MKQIFINQTQTADGWSDMWHWPVMSSVSTSTRRTVRPGCLQCQRTQNGNTDICVINRTSENARELVVLSFSGSLKSVYPEQGQREEFNLIDVVCDSYSNIIVSEALNSSVHLLSPEGEFMRYLLTENQVNHRTVLSLKKSTLWIGNLKGLVKVFQYTSWI